MALGQIRMPLNGRQYFVVTGGPYMDRPSTMRGVKMAAEINKPADVDIPTIDFRTPDPAMLATRLEQAVKLLLAGQPLYVGCMGGKGRTGLFLAVLAKAMGVPQPVEYVRNRYYSHAVETNDQYTYVADFVIPASVTRAIRRARWTRGWKFWKRNLTRLPAPEGELTALKVRVPVTPTRRVQ